MPSPLVSIFTSGPRRGLERGMMVGLALVAAMPVANSSVAWCQNARGNMALGLGLIVVTIVLSPVATPQMLKLMGYSTNRFQIQTFDIRIE